MSGPHVEADAPATAVAGDPPYTPEKWAGLSERLHLTLDAERLHELGARAARAFAEELRAIGVPPPEAVPDAWLALGQDAIRAQQPRTSWVSPSTALLCHAPPAPPTRPPPAEVASRGAVAAAPIIPADGQRGRHVAYRRWLPLAGAIDDRSVSATAFFSPAIAARLPIEVFAPAGADFSYQGDALRVRHGAGEIEIDVRFVCFIGMMWGLLPEHAILGASSLALERLRRLDALSAAVSRRFGVPAVRFATDTPVFRTAGGDVFDVSGGAQIREGSSDPQWPERFRLAVRDPLTPGCTCAGPHGIRAVLEREDELHTVEMGSAASRPLVAAVGDGRVLVFEVCCTHAARRPAALEWERAGRDRQACLEAWRSLPVLGPLATRHSITRTAHAVLVHGNEIAGVAADDVALAWTASRVGLEADAEFTAYAPGADILLLTTERIDCDPGELRRIFRKRGPGRDQMLHGFALGREVGYLRVASVRASA